MPKSVAGTALYADFIDNNGTIPIHGDFTKFNFPRKIDKVDVTAGADAARNYIPTIKDYTLSIESFFNKSGGTPSMGTAALNRLKEGNFGTLRWGAEGNGTGKQKGAALVFVETQEVEMPFDNAMTVKLDFQVTGGLLSDPNVDVW